MDPPTSLPARWLTGAADGWGNNPARPRWKSFHLAICALVFLLSATPDAAVSHPQEPGQPASHAKADTSDQLDLEAEPDLDSRETAGSRLRLRLRFAINDPADPDLRLSTECHTDRGHQSLRVWGNGVAICNRRSQVLLSAEEIDRLLVAVLESGFPDLAPIQGGEEEPSTSAVASPRLQPPQLVCRVELELDELKAQAVQLAKGVQLVALTQLAERLLQVCETPSQLAVKATSLEDGLAKIAEGLLAPETLLLVLQHRPGGPGFHLKLEGVEVTIRSFDPEQGFQEPVTVQLPTAEVRALALDLMRLQPSTLPSNLRSAGITELSLTILDQVKSIQARLSLRPGGETTPQANRSFTEVLDRMEAFRLAAVRQSSSTLDDSSSSVRGIPGD